jgi:2'-5' RNA ligase
MEQIRAFIAIELPEALKAEIARLQEQLKVKGRVPARWVNPGNIHLTLKFLGDIDGDAVDDILHAMDGAASNAQSFRLSVKGLGVFPNPQRPRIIWVGLAGSVEKLKNLQRGIDIALDRLGFPGEKRSFSPHLTIARIQDRATPAERQAIGQLVESSVFTTRADFNADTVYLIKSQLTREGPIYSRLGSVSLG